jgi:NADPH:quinone reductase-like Zn-dependent oxidoreductase
MARGWRSGAGAHVVTTSSGANLDFLRGLGADETLDCATTRFEETVHDIDVVMDALGGDTVDRSWRLLRRGGAMISVAEQIPDSRGLFFFAEPSRDQLENMAAMIDRGRLKVIVTNVPSWLRLGRRLSLGCRGTIAAKSFPKYGMKHRA